ncbi:HPS3 [Lepeophtheirus salmonis]|uniref:HPS3 n=1 Tax=Lepeophtheirus salmonis TaxID=72036 RepID=A0A7R8D025_LEPSM|nr:HPS3 [Lepeophtheirus salmonis]CAF2980647.1 HPS3 [Lepeophtheirus salmonis]
MSIPKFNTHNLGLDSRYTSDDNMVRVISVHHFVSEDVTPCCSSLNVASAGVATDLNFLLIVYQDESPNVESILYSTHGQYFLFLEKPLAYPRIAGAVSPCSGADGEAVVLDVIEFGSIKGCPPVVCCVCPSTEIFSPTEISLVEDVLGILSSTEFHLFKIKIREKTDERKHRSLSVYSFCSDSEFINQGTLGNEYTNQKGGPQFLRLDSHNNITLKRQQDSETSQVGHLEGYVGNIVRHKDFKDIDGPDWSNKFFPEVEEANKEYLSLGSPKIMTQVFGPFTESPESTSIKIIPSLDKLRPDSEFEADFNEGYLYHVPGHLRKRGRGCGVQRIATYPFTAPVRKIALEPSLLHALTETGLETYTLRSGYYTLVSDHFKESYIWKLSLDRLVLISKEEIRHTITILKLPSHFDIYKDMIQLAELNKESSPHGCSQLLCEAHIVLRTWFHRLSWALLEAGNKREEIPITMYPEKKKRNGNWLCLIIGYQGKPISFVIDQALKARESVNYLPMGFLHYLTEVLLHPTIKENVLDSVLTDKIIGILGLMAIDKLAFIVLRSSQFRSFKTKKMYDIFKKYLIQSKSIPNAEEVLAFALLSNNNGGGEESGARELIRSLPNVALSEILIEHHYFLLDMSISNNTPDTFSDLALLIRDSVPEIFVEGSLFVNRDNSNAVVLQLFLETFFVEFLENPTQEDPDILQVLKSLIRSYLSCISTPIRFGDKNIDSDIFGPRDLYLEMLPPFQYGGSRETLLDAESPEFWCQNSLLKLQSLLCCPILTKNRSQYYEIVLDYLSIYPDTVGAISLKIICSDNPIAIQALSESHPEVLLTFCKERITEEKDWRFLLETLQEHLSTEPNHPYHEEWYSSVQEILNYLAQTLSLDLFMSILPSPMQGNEDYQGYIQMCRKIQQAQQLKGLISNTGQQLLSTLAL